MNNNLSILLKKNEVHSKNKTYNKSRSTKVNILKKYINKNYADTLNKNKDKNKFSHIYHIHK